MSDEIDKYTRSLCRGPDRAHLPFTSPRIRSPNVARAVCHVMGSDVRVKDNHNGMHNGDEMCIESC